MLPGPRRSVIARLCSPGVAAPLLYLALSFLFFGLRPLVEAGSQYVGAGNDPQIFIWSFAWWPHAILHGENPFYTHAIWAPAGVNLAWTTSVPGLALAFSPLTLLAGAVVSYDVAAVAMPALAAWTAFLLCRHLTRAFWPSLVGGYVFGFSSYMLGQQVGHLHATSVFLIPLVALVVLRYLEGGLDGRGLVVRLGPLLGLELLFSTEVSLTLALALACALLLAFAFVADRRSRLVASLVPLGGSYVLAAVLTSPFLYYALTGVHTGAFVPPQGYTADLLNFVVPTNFELTGSGWASSIANHFPANDGERGAYVGLPALVVVALFARRGWRTRGGRFLLAFLALAAFAALGGALHVYGRRLFPLEPWHEIERLPLWDNVLPVRFALYVSLGVAVIVALWTASRRPGVLRWLLPALVVLTLVPNVATGSWVTTYAIPAFFTDRAYRSCLAPGETILPLPIGEDGNPMLWQVVADFRFRMAGGRIATTPPTTFMHPPSIARVSLGYPIPARQAGLLAGYVQAKGVGAVVVDKAAGSGRWSAALDRLATRRDVGGVLLYGVAGSGPACGA